MKLIHLIILFILFGCKAQNITCVQHYNFIKMEGKFNMEILFYSPATPCGGGRAYASNCIGRTIENDTLRVLSLCNNDTTFERGQYVTVSVREKPNFHVSASKILKKDNLGGVLPDNQFVNTPTIYGEIQK